MNIVSGLCRSGANAQSVVIRKPKKASDIEASVKDFVAAVKGQPLFSSQVASQVGTSRMVQLNLSLISQASQENGLSMSPSGQQLILVSVMDL